MFVLLGGTCRATSICNPARSFIENHSTHAHYSTEPVDIRFLLTCAYSLDLHIPRSSSRGLLGTNET